MRRRRAGRPPTLNLRPPSRGRAAAVRWNALSAFAVPLLLLVLVLANVKGPAAVALTLVTVFAVPGLAWRALTGTTVNGPFEAARTVAVSVAVTIVIGLALNAASIGLTRTHWAAAMTVLVAVAAAVAVGRRSPWPGETAPRDLPSSDPSPRRLFVHVALAAACVLLATGGGIVAWQSQQHWLRSQHFTQLYARTTSGGGERVVVRNHEGKPTDYRIVITAAGTSGDVQHFTLADDAVWTHDTVVDPGAARPSQPLLQATLYVGSSGSVYREIRLP